MKKILVVMSAENVRPGGGIIQMILGYKEQLDKDKDLQVDYAMNADPQSRLAELLTENRGVFYQLPNKKKYLFQYMIMIFRICKVYDCIHIHGSSGLMAMETVPAWLAGVPVRIVHSRNTACDHKYADKILRPVMYRTATHFFACGEEAGKWLFGNRNFTVIKNGKYLNRFRYDETIRRKIRQQYAWENKVVLGHVGNYNYQKNYGFLLEVFRAVQDKVDYWQFVLIGDGQARKSIEEKAAQMGLCENITFMGSVSNMPEILQAMDIMVLPSRFEGLPNVVLEWQASGLPSLISDVITKECAPTDLVRFAALEEGMCKWAEKLVNMAEISGNRREESMRAIKELKEAGFDIYENAKDLKEIYLRLIRKTIHNKGKGDR